MSLKLGNTNIAGTQILYSTTGNNVDGAMTQATTTTELGLKANDADVVHKTGDETINGLKTILDYGLDFINTSATKGVDPDGYRYWAMRINANNGSSSWVDNRLGLWETRLDANGNTNMYFGVYKNETSSQANAMIQCIYNKSGNYGYATAPASDVSNSIVTTVNKSKSENGYFQLGNGLIINWGRTSNVQQTNVTFSKAYSSASSYAIVAVPYTSSNSSQDGYSSYITNLSSTGCTIWNKMYGNSISAIKHWIAIGY